MTAVAVILALGAAVVAQKAPDVRTVRVEGDDDARLNALSSAVSAELVAAGFTLLAARDGTEPSGVVRLRMADDHCAVVTATAIDAGKVFQSLVGCEGKPGSDLRAGDQVALQVAEWMDGATWLPPAPEPAPAPLVRQVADLAEPRARSIAPAIARSPSLVDTIDVGTAVMHTPGLGTRFGAELGASMRSRSAVLAGAVPFARLSLAYEWFGSAVTDVAGERFDTSYATLAIAGGLSRRLGRHWSAEANANLGVTLVRFSVVVMGAGSSAGVLFYQSDRLWEARSGAAIGIVRDLTPRSSLALEARASWLSPGFFFQTSYANVGQSYWPAITVALALGLKP